MPTKRFYPWPPLREPDRATSEFLARWDQEGAPSIFINYRHTDKYAARLLDEDLSDCFGTQALFRATRSIAPGVNYITAIHEAIKRSRVMLAIIGLDWADSIRQGKHEWAVREIEEAQAIEKPVIPVFLSNSIPPPANNYDIWCLEPELMPPGIRPEFAQVRGFEYGAKDALD
ncbi:MAG TPA: toll/interleukin-1 receptor domain-containing protein, partial [Candidatus Saccharimonadales bacterium]|nr:toll/interleukin-1 receptor domain-containing protein [Candidatus Saccharimonadales bacterium]